jgi:4-aminobutyrate aminotransferase-like enzyme/Ser/Thr protein kinase RdoA (MazF antagonist)
MNAPKAPPTVEDAAALLAHEYGLEGEVVRLAGENENYRISLGDGRRYVLKLADESLGTEDIELEHAAIESVVRARVGVALPRLVPTSSGRIEASHARGGVALRGRLLEFVAGTAWIEAGEPSSGQLRDFGHVLARVNLALASVEHPAARRTHRWDLERASQHWEKVSLVADPKRRRVLESAFHLFAACAAPRIPELPRALIHADANDENVLVEGGRVAGLLDFGDCMENATICDLAIALAYMLLDAKDPLAAGAEIVGAYHEVRPLSIDELEALFPLVAGRLATSVAIAAERRLIDPDRASWFTSEARAWALLERLDAIPPATAARALGARTGLAAFADAGPGPEELIERRAKHVGRALSVSYREPLKMVRGQGQYLHAHDGRAYLDLVNNVCHVGHCHPRVVAAGQRQMARLNTNTRYLYDGLVEYAERLCATMPAPLDTCFFVNSGSEANELALRIAMTHTGRRDMLVVDGAYHGNSARLIDLSPYKFMGKGGAGRPEPWVHVAPLADGYRGPHRGMGRDAGVAYGDEVGAVIASTQGPIAGFITESLLSCGGQVIPPAGYFETAFRHVRAAGGLCIADEVQVGFGRLGTHFWAFEAQGVVPDIVVMGKPIGNGHPMAAVVTSRAIADSFANGMEYFSTFGGNPVSCAIGLAVLDVVRDEGLQAHALEVGARLRDGLRGLMDRHAIVGDVRGLGLFIGVELVRDRESLEPAAEEATELVNRLRDRRMLLSTDGPLHNVIKIKPPMVLTAEDVDMVVRCFDDELVGL